MKKFIENIKQYWQTTDFGFIKKPDFILQFCGWLFSYLLLVYALNYSFSWQILWFLFFLYFWSRFNDDVIKYLKPPVEALLILMAVLYAIFFIHSNISLSINPAQFAPGLILKLLILLLATVISLVLVMNSEKKTDSRRDILIIYTLLGIFAHYLIIFEHLFYHYVLQLILFFMLLKRTIWIEHLTKKQLVVYFITFLVVYLAIDDPENFQSYLYINRQNAFFTIFMYLHYIIKIYFLALVVKIPIVSIYNHARLSRKLWIAGLFQSTFPQIIQFIFLVLIFCFFLSGWQAQNFLDSFNDLRDEFISGSPPSGISISEQYIDADSPYIYLDDYQAVRFAPNYPDMGILAFPGMQQESDYYLYMKILNNITLVKIDEQFCRELTGKMNVVSGKGVLIYPFAPRPVMEYLYSVDFWQGHNYLKIFPLGLISNNQTWSMKSTVNDKDIIRMESFQNNRDRYLVLGRVYLPIVNKDPQAHTYFAFDIYHELQTAHIGTNTSRILVGLLFIFLLLNALVIRRVGKFGSQINKIIIQKFGQLKNGIREISTGNLEYKVKLEGEDEFVEFANHFNTMSDKLKQTIEESREKERMDHELKMAREVQISLLPKSLPKLEGFSMATTIQAATEVGGDFYDVIAITDKKVLFTLGDVSGKGSSAAFYMAQFLSLLRYSTQFTQKPDEIAIRINRYFTENVTDRKIFITAIIGVLDINKNTVSLVRAGHTSPILIPGKSEQAIEEIDISGLAIGLTADGALFRKSLPLFEYKFMSNDKVLFFTDGVIEATNPGNMEQYGDDNLIQIIEKNRNGDSQSLVDVISHDLDRFYGNNPPVDDYAILVLNKLA
jgi:serine phosphatase RsbU (regulator of sigma subunit)